MLGTGFDHLSAHALTAEEVNRWVTPGVVGRYALGFRDKRGRFRTQFLGSSSGDLNSVLKRQAGVYREFKFIAEEARVAAAPSTSAPPRVTASKMG
jgi:hypothetical protein